ncbi:Hypothetical predicted protein, partial [Pelobates cultripes]
QWREILSSHKTMTLCTSHIELSRNIIYRWYLVPTRLKQSFPNTSDTCWRCQKDRGDMIHVWWHCPQLNKYRQKLHGDQSPPPAQN